MKPMAGTEMAHALQVIGWSRCELARRRGCRETLIRRMEAGTRRVEPELAAWLRRAVAWHEAHPVPTQEKTGPFCEAR
jgi:ribosome-binding protein aMBF1 (putative translation factor)